MTRGEIPPTEGNIRAALSYISPDLPRSEWAKVGMAIKHALADDGFPLFDEWSKAHHLSIWHGLAKGGQRQVVLQAPF
jgi:hypothetical protein